MWVVSDPLTSSSLDGYESTGFYSLVGPQDIYSGALSLMAAAGEDLFDDVDSVAQGLGGLGWERGTRAGYWRWPHNAAVELRVLDDIPDLQMTVRGSDRAMCLAAQALVGHLEARGLHRTGVDPWWMTWPSASHLVDQLLGYNWNWMLLHTGRVNVALNVASAHQQDRHHLPAALNFSVERSDLQARRSRANRHQVPPANRHGFTREESTGQPLSAAELLRAPAENEPAVAAAARLPSMAVPRQPVADPHHRANRTTRGEELDGAEEEQDAVILDGQIDEVA